MSQVPQEKNDDPALAPPTLLTANPLAPSPPVVPTTTPAASASAPTTSISNAATATTTTTVAAAAGAKRPPQAPATTAVPAVKKPNTNSTTQQLQQQIQQQLQQQLQAQLQAAAARGQQANITPEQIQAQAQAMVQAAAQAQAVVAAAKSRGDGLVPMNAAQIQALSQIQAQAIVHARKSSGTPQQIQTQIQLQAQALVHAHTQAQIQAGIYKGEVKEESKNARGAAASAPTPAAVTASAAAAKITGNNSTAASTAVLALTPSQIQQQADLKRQHESERAANPSNPAALAARHQTQLDELQASFRQQNSSLGLVPNPVLNATSMDIGDESSNALTAAQPQPSSNSPQFLAQLNGSLNSFWQDSFDLIQKLQEQTEQDFKNHNDLPLARIKRIMKSDEDVRMISAEAPVLFAKACELFILDLSIRSWNYSQLHKRRTLQKEDVREAIQKTDIFDFLVDVIQ
jgi:nuclear transcription factor Y gamma